MKNSYDDIFLMEDLEQEIQVQEKAPKKSGGRFFLILLIILLLLSVFVLGGLLLLDVPLLLLLRLVITSRSLTGMRSMIAPPSPLSPYLIASRALRIKHSKDVHL